MAIKFSKGYEPPQEGSMQYAGYGDYGDYEAYSDYAAHGGCTSCPGSLDAVAYGAFYGLPDDPRADIRALQQSSVSGYGQAPSEPSRATWFLLGAASVLAWPMISEVIGLGA